MQEMVRIFRFNILQKLSRNTCFIDVKSQSNKQASLSFKFSTISHIEHSPGFLLPIVLNFPCLHASSFTNAGLMGGDGLRQVVADVLGLGGCNTTGW